MESAGYLPTVLCVHSMSSLRLGARLTARVFGSELFCIKALLKTSRVHIFLNYQVTMPGHYSCDCTNKNCKRQVSSSPEQDPGTAVEENTFEPVVILTQSPASPTDSQASTDCNYSEQIFSQPMVLDEDANQEWETEDYGYGPILPEQNANVDRASPFPTENDKRLVKEILKKEDGLTESEISFLQTFANNSFKANKLF